MVGVPAAGCNRAGALAPSTVRSRVPLCRRVESGPEGAAAPPGLAVSDYRGVSRKRSSSLSVPRMKNVLGSMVRS